MMSEVGLRALFYVTSISHGIMILYTIWRISRREAVSDEGKSAFQPINIGRPSNLQTAVISQGAEPDGTPVTEEKVAAEVP